MERKSLKDRIKPIVYPIINFIPRRRLKNKNFTIICDNCWAGKVYQELGLPYQTPFVGMFVFSPDYIKMLKNIKHYLSGNIPLKFVKESKYIKDFDNSYPLALLDDIELHFLHYADEEEATQKWNRRLKRMHWDNLYFKFNDNDACTYELMKEFEELPYKSKVIFSSKNYSDLPSLVHFKSAEKQGHVGIRRLNQMKKIRLIIPYFGKLPKFFPYFLLTAKRNQKIDFLIYTDQKVDQFTILNANNIEFVTLSFDELREKVQSKFDFKISLKTPYKLCDYKVAYGLIFEEELKGYDYWGFCDTDVLLGDIYQFLEEHSFFENDYVRYGLLGHLQIFKNSQEVNRIFMSGKDLNYRLNYKNVFTSEQNFIFDEEKGIQILFEKSGFEQLQDKFFDDIDISHFSFREYGEDEPKRYYSWSQKHGLKSINLIDGQLVIKHPLYAHFQKRTIECPEFEPIESFYVIPNKLVFGEELSIQEIEEVTKNKFYWTYWKRILRSKLNIEKYSIGFIRHKLRMKK